MSDATTRLDLKGLKCPLPALRTRKALRRMPAGGVLIVECTDPLAPIDIVHLVRELGASLEEKRETAGVYLFRIRAP